MKEYPHAITKKCCKCGRTFTCKGMGWKLGENGKWYRHPPPLNELQLLCSNCHIIVHSKLDNRGLPI
jgi:hypothetical protein